MCAIHVLIPWQGIRYRVLLGHLAALILYFFLFALGPTSGPRGAFGAKKSAIDAENARESEMLAEIIKKNINKSTKIRNN